MIKRKIVIGSRESKLAVIQSESVLRFIREQFPQTEVSILTMKTTGDQILDQALEKVGGKGLFVKELDHALADGRTDLSVHSLKDVPMEIPENIPLVAFSVREDPRDVLVLPEGQTEIDFSKPVGCSSKRRMAQFRKLYPQAKFATIRGNVQTRLRRVDEGEFSATILAAAGLKRLGLENRISRYFSPEEMVPAAGQGILAVQGRAGEDYSWLEAYNDREAESCALAERAFVRALGGSCSEPIAAYASVEGETLRLRAFYQDEKTDRVYTGTIEGNAKEPERAGRELAGQFLKKKGCGKVWLVGAGPSDPGLFTLKGKQVLEEAEVVVYDALVGAAVLAMIPDTAEAINVGKRAGHHLKRQEKISALLAEKALEGKRVVRLKGGDPFLFGRGGEELEVLAREEIPYEVVPGVTSALAVPAYQGIPVTHRDYCSSVHIITGHQKQGESYDIDFEALVRTKGTLIFLMGVSSLAEICEGLPRAGIDPKMPAAFLSRGTMAAQERIVADVSTLPEAVRARGAVTPAIIVVGRVCALAEKFAWAEKLPLGGVRVLVTRPRETAGTTAGRLRALGAEVLELPAIRTVRKKENERLAKALEQAESYDWIVFTSPIGVKMFFEELKERKTDLRRFAKAKFAVIGSGSAQELEKRGLYADLMPEVYDGEHLGAALAARCREEAAHGKTNRVLIPRAELGNRELVEEIQKAEKIIIDDIATYDTVYEMSGVLDARAEMDGKTIDYVMFTSASTVKGFAAAVGDMDDREIKAICIGRQTEEAARSLGMRTWTAEQATIDSLIETLVRVHHAESV